MRKYSNLRQLWPVFLVGLVCFGGCGDGLSFGLAGCEADDAPAFESTPANTVAGATHLTLTAAGTDFLISQRELLAGLLFDVDANGQVALELPQLDFGDAGGGFGVGVRDLAIGFDLRRVRIDLEVLPDPARIRLSVRQARVALTDGVVWISVGGDAACRLGNGLAVGTPEAALLEADFALDIQPTVDADGRLQIQVDVLPFAIEQLDFELVYDANLPECSDGATSAECRLACGAGDLAAEIGEALYDAFETQINALLQPVVQGLASRLIDAFTDQPLAIEGALHPRIIASLLPTAVDAHPLGFRAAPSPDGFTLRSAGDDGDGIGLTADIGLDAIDHPCVPAVDAAPPFVPGPAPTLTGYDHMGQPYHLGLALSAAVVNRATWVAYRGGVLCAALSTDEIDALLGQRIDTAALALILPGVAELAQGPRPIRVALDPAFTAADLPLATFFAVPDDGGIPQAGIALRLPRLGLSFYAQIEERWTRLFAAQVSVAVDLIVQATPDNRLAIMVGQPRLDGLQQTYNELLSGANLPDLLTLITDLLTSALLREGLAFDLGLDGLVQQISGLPLNAQIAALRVDGANDDFLSVLIRLGLARRGAGARAAVNTGARLIDATPGIARLAVDATADALYQWRVGDGPWRPLRAAANGQLHVDDPRLTLLGTHRIAVRAVAKGDYQSLDPTPAIVDVQITAPPPTPVATPAPPSATGTGGCQQQGGGASIWALALLGVLGWRRRKWVVLGLLASAGCDDPKPAPDIVCAVSADCPGGLLCLSERCVQPTPCLSNLECCPDAECRAGGCVPLAATCADDAECAGLACVDGRCQQPVCAGGCAGGQCIAGHCQVEPPCRGQCGADEACFGHLNVCRAVACDVVCAPGEVRMAVAPERFSGPECQVTDADCDCVAAPPILPADVGRHASMAVVANRAEFVAWDADFGDLVHVEGVEDGAPRLTYLDGVPDGAAQADPSGPRGGVTVAGPDRGRYAHLAFDLKGRPNVVYYDAAVGALRYIRRNEDGQWIAPIVIDADGDAGRYPRVAIDGLGFAHIVYSVVATVDAQAGLRYAVARSTEPMAAIDFDVQTIASQPIPAPIQAPPPGITPAVFGVRPCMQVGPDGRVYAAFYDGEAQRPMLAVGGPDGFAVQPIEGPRNVDWPPDPGGRYDRFETHDLGGFCALVVGQDALHVALLDATTDALVVWSAAIGGAGGLDGAGVFDLVDPGGRGVRRLVGADPSMALSATGEPIVVYQDATDNDVLMAARAPFGWEITAVATAGALGFYNTLVVQDDVAIVGTLELRTIANGRGAHRLHVFRVDAPRF